MTTTNQQYALFVRNAKACENAKHPKCRCACGGAYHGKSHAAKLEELWASYQERERQLLEKEQPDQAQLQR